MTHGKFLEDKGYFIRGIRDSHCLDATGLEFRILNFQDQQPQQLAITEHELMPRTTVHTSHVLFNCQKALGDRHQYRDRSHFIDEDAEAGRVMKLGLQPTERLKPNAPLSCSPAGYLPVTGKLREQNHLPVPPNPGSKSGCLSFLQIIF